MDDFHGFGLPAALSKALDAMQFSTPTPIQAQAIPHALEGRDILGSAQTGTGKTGAFGIPLVAKLLNNPRGTALVMTPTRELATQVMTQLQAMLGKHSPIKTALLIGGEAMPKQMQQLRARPRLMVGTPGRINDHLERGNLMLHDTNFLVLDETDRMLDMGFTIQIEKILKFMPKTRQTMLFSATLPKDIIRISQSYLNNPERVAVDPTSSPATNIDHKVAHVTVGEKYGRLLDELESRDGSIIVFVKTKHNTDKMATRLAKDGFDARAIHGDLRQNKRDSLIANFRKQKYRILVATDVAARGLDIPHIEHVINFDLPQVAEDYIHRIGRTARAGAEGAAICFVTPSDKLLWRAIERLLDPEAAKNHADDERPAGKPRGRGKPQGGRGRAGDKRTRSDKPRGDKKRDDKPRGDKKRDDKPRGEKRRDDKPRGEKSDWAGKPKGDKPRSDKPRSDKPRSDKPRREESRSDRPKGDRPRSDKPRGDKPQAARGRDGDKRTRSDKPRSDKPRRDDSRSDRPRSDKPKGGKPRSDKPRSDKPRSDKPRSDKPRGEKSGKPAGRRKVGAGGGQAPRKRRDG